MNNTHKKPLGTGNRIRVAITLTGLRINEFCRKSGLPSSTVWGWHGGRLLLNKKGALRLSEKLSLFGVKCSPEWLLEGTGISPQIKGDIFNLFDKKFLNEKENDSLIISGLTRDYEIDVFSKINKNSTILISETDSMAPEILKGDFVGGIALSKESLHEAFGRNCIVKLKNGKSIIRRVMPGKKEDLYKLVALNPFTDEEDPILYDQVVLEIAPIIFIRREDIAKKQP
jgi:hypothetical protein